MIRRLLLILVPLISLLVPAFAFAGYELYVAPQVPEFITVNGPYGAESYRNPELSVLHRDHYCKPANYSRAAAETIRRTEVIRTSTGSLSAADVLAICPAVLDSKYNRLWEAASAWERKYISGVALSLLTLGVSHGLPKATAIAEWSDRLWNGTYYPRKALVNLDTDPDCDFSVVGDMPYSIPELSDEVWGR